MPLPVIDLYNTIFPKKSPQSPSIRALRGVLYTQALAWSALMNCSKETLYLIVILLPSSTSIRSTSLAMIVCLLCALALMPLIMLNGLLTGCIIMFKRLAIHTVLSIFFHHV